MAVPSWVSARYAVKGVYLAAVGLTVALSVVIAVVQTIRIDGFQVKLPLVGWVGPQGWKPYAENLENAVVKVKFQLEKANDNHRQTKANYAEAQKQAAQQQKEYVDRVVKRQTEISNASQQVLDHRIRDIRARFDRLRAETERAGAGSAPREVRVPEGGDTAPRPDQAPDCQRFPAASVAEDLECRRIATEQATQLDLLIDWVEAQKSVTE